MLNMLKEGGEYSLTRCLTVIGYFSFLVLSFYLALTGKTWGNYDGFATAAGGAFLSQIANKFINSKYNTVQGELGKKLGEKNDLE